MEEIKRKILAKEGRLKRYRHRPSNANKMGLSKRTKYRDFDFKKTQGTNEQPDTNEAKQFCCKIWEQEENIRKAEWIKKTLKKNCKDIEKYLQANLLAQSAKTIQYTDCFSAGGGKIHTPTSISDMILNNLMVRFQQCWSFWECGVPLHYHRSQVHSSPEW